VAVTEPQALSESPAIAVASGRLLRGPFAILCLSSLAFYSSMMMFLATLPLYAAESLRMSQGEIGLVIGAFPLMAMLCKPHAGWALDALGRRPVLLAGVGIFLAASLLYTTAGALWSLVLLRAFHGAGMGLYPTAGAAVVADLAPPARRGEGMGYFSATGSLAMAVGPAAGMALVDVFSFRDLCLASAATALLSLLLAWRVPETGKRLPVPLPPLSLDGLFSRRAIFPSVVLFCLFISYGGIFTFFPLLARQGELQNSGWFFTVFAMGIMLVRAKGGTLSDRYGRVRVIVPSLVCCGAAVAALGILRSAPALLAVGAFYAAAFGMASPALMAMATDGVPPEERGRAVGTLLTAWEMGIGCGAVVLGQVLSWSGGNFVLAYGLAGAMAVGGAALALFRRR
jgi:predicted MFS family arabinose efflux permease